MSTIFADKFKNTSGGNPVQVNQLRGIDTAGSITVQGEGTATTNLQQGLVKSWCKFNGTGTLAVNDSFNISSVSDGGTGVYSPIFTNNMVNEHFSADAIKRNESTNTGAQIQIPSYASNTNNIQMHESDNPTDSSSVSYSTRGDLA